MIGAQRMENALWGLLTTVGRLPRDLAVALGHGAGLLLWALDGRHRRIARRNLSRGLGDRMGPADRGRIERAVFGHLGRMPFEIGWSLNLSPREFGRHFTVRGREHLLRALRQGKGALMLTGHMGNWELGPIVYHLLGGHGAVVFRPLDSPAMDGLLRRIRSRFGNHLIANRRAMREILRCLRQGRMVTMLMDQNVDWYEGVFVDFFGRRACTNKGMALLALKTGAPVLPIFVSRKGHRFVVEIQPEVPLVRSGDKTRDVETNTQRYNAVIEAAICRHPEQWFWVHQRWKTRPYQTWPRRQPPAAGIGRRNRRVGGIK